MTSHGPNGRTAGPEPNGRHDRGGRHGTDAPQDADTSSTAPNGAPHAADERAERVGHGAGVPAMTFFVHLAATAAWLALSQHDRQEVMADEIAPMLPQHPDVSVRWFDAESWSARPSNVLVATTTDPRAWTELFAQLRNTSLWTVPYFEVELIVPGEETTLARRPGRHGAAYAARHGSAD